MKVNANTLDPETRFHTLVFLDGVEAKDCVEADDEEGYVVLLDLDAGGNPQYDHVLRDVLLKTVKGHVEIKRRESDNRSDGPGSSYEGG